MENKLFKYDAKQIVDLCFDNKLFNGNVTRDHMTMFEDLISYMLQSRYDSYVKTTELLARIEKVTANE